MQTCIHKYTYGNQVATQHSTKIVQNLILKFININITINYITGKQFEKIKILMITKAKS